MALSCNCVYSNTSPDPLIYFWSDSILRILMGIQINQNKLILVNLATSSMKEMNDVTVLTLFVVECGVCKNADYKLLFSVQKCVLFRRFNF